MLCCSVCTFGTSCTACEALLECASTGHAHVRADVQSNLCYLCERVSYDMLVSTDVRDFGGSYVVCMHDWGSVSRHHEHLRYHGDAAHVGCVHGINTIGFR